MHLSNHFFILPLIFAIFGTPLAFADIEFVGVDIFCPLEELLGFTGIVSFLEICPINTSAADDLELTKLTPVQAIFDPEKLVDSKTTLLKLDIKNTFADTKTAQVTLVIDGEPPIIENVDIVPGTESYFLPSTNFIFPTGSELTASAEIEIIAGEADTTNNIGSFTIPVQDTRSLRFLYTPVELVTDLNLPPSCPAMGILAENSKQYMTGSYPLSGDDYDQFVSCIRIPIIPTTPDFKLDDEGLANLYSILDSLKWFGFDKVVGVVRDGWFMDNTISVVDPTIPTSEGLTLSPFLDAVIIEQDNNLGIATAHEIFHTIVDLRHTPQITAEGMWTDKGCQMGFFDTNTNQCDESMRAIDFMVDSTDPLRVNGQVDGVIRAWIEKDQFNDLFQKLSIGPFDPSVIGIKGIIFDNGTMVSGPWYRLESDLDIPLNSAGEFSLLYLDQADQLIAQTAFNVSRTYSESGIETGIGAFAIRVPDVIGTNKIVIERQVQTIFERTVTSNSPVVTILSPNGGELFVHGVTINVSWQSTDLDGDEISHVVLLSEDGGQTFAPLVVDLVDTQFSFEAPSNIQSDTVLIKVIASDGINTSEDLTDNPLTIREFQGNLLHTINNPLPDVDDHFGSSVAGVGNDKLLVGAPDDDAVKTNSGSVYLFDATNGQLLLTLNNPTPKKDDHFGDSVAGVGDDKLLVGAPQDDTGAHNTGSVYLFNATTGQLLLTINNPFPSVGDSFGIAIAGVGNDKLLVGATEEDTGARNTGSAYLFDATNGQLLLTINNPTPEDFDRFGHSVAGIGNDKLLVGALNDNTGATSAGSAYLFDATTGQLLQTLNNPTPDAGDRFGNSLAGVGNDKLLIGADGDDTGATSAGSAYLFNATTGQLLLTINNPTPEDSEQFGLSVAGVGNDKLLVGAPDDNTGGTNAGSVYLFDATTGQLLLTINNPFPNDFDQFGDSVDVVGNIKLLVGAFSDNTGAANAGSAYLFG